MTSEETHSTLNTKKLSIGYGSVKTCTLVCENITFELQQGSLIGLVGANGVGKSTLLRTLSGMQPPLAGDIFIDGQALSEIHPITLATKLSVVLTEPPASKNLTVRELVSLGRQPYTNAFGQLSEVDKQVVDDALRSTETQTLADKKCFELSDGQLQRAVIARALAQDTNIILLDEPTTHLDIYHRAYVLRLLKQLALEKNKTILFSTHEIDLAIQLADLLVVMNNKEIRFGSPDKLISEGAFDELFPKDTIHFDTESGRFTIRN